MKDFIVSDYPEQAELLRRFRYDPDAGKVLHLATDKPAFTAIDDGYLKGRVGSRVMPAHVVIWVMVHGYYPRERGLVVDHINGNRSDNRFSNLRCVSVQENLRNRHSKPIAASGIRGVYENTPGRFQARIRVAGRHKNLGIFDTVREAAIARIAAEKALGFNPQKMPEDTQ